VNKPEQRKTVKIYKDEIDLRLKDATSAELIRMRECFNLKPSSGVTEITDEFRTAAGNSIVNVARNFELTGAITYREILEDVISKIQSVGDDFQELLDKVKSLKGKKVAKENAFSIEELEWELINIASKKISSESKLMNPYISKEAAGSLVYAAVSRGVFFAAGGPVTAAISAILIPAALSGPAYRKTVNATLELILIGRRQAIEKGKGKL